MSEWQPIETAPKDGSGFLAYGSYQYPDDPDQTDYIEIAQYTGFADTPWLDCEGMHPPEFFSHWMPLPEPPQ